MSGLNHGKELKQCLKNRECTMGSYEKYMTDRLEDTSIYRSTMQLSADLEKAQADIRKLQEDMAHLVKNRNFASSPEEQRIYDLKS